MINELHCISVTQSTGKIMTNRWHFSCSPKTWWQSCLQSGKKWQFLYFPFSPVLLARQHCLISLLVLAQPISSRHLGYTIVFASSRLLRRCCKDLVPQGHYESARKSKCHWTGKKIHPRGGSWRCHPILCRYSKAVGKNEAHKWRAVSKKNLAWK